MIWQVFTKHSKEAYKRDNVHFFPVSNTGFINSFVRCTGIFTSSGFETPAEAIFMGKKVLTIPIRNQYEQYCNAAALSAIGITVLKEVNNKSVPLIQEWVKNGKAINIQYPDLTAEIIQKEIFDKVEFVPQNN